jgi:putative flippase GtrA
MKIFRYAAVGGAAALIDFLIFAVFAKILGFNYLLVGAAGFIIATTVNYFLSIRFVFISGVRFTFHKEISLVFLISLVGLGLNQLVLYLGIGILAWEMLFVKVCATGSVFFWNFGARSYFIFKPLETAAAREDGPLRQVTEKDRERHRLN